MPQSMMRLDDVKIGQDELSYAVLAGILQSPAEAALST